MKKLGLFNIKIFLLSIIVVFGGKIVFAQTTDTSDNLAAPYTNLPQDEYDKLPLSARLPNDIKEQISVDINPEVPRPGDKVTISVSAYGGINVNASVIDWIVDGKSILKGVGKKTFSFYPPGNGVTNTVELHIKPQYGPEVVRTYKFDPSDVDILWQADTYTPPFYKGKALYTPQANVKFVAMPNITLKNGGKLQPKNTVYSWELNYTPDAANSGYGVNYYDFTGSVLSKPTNVRVTAYDPLNKSSQGVGTLDLEPIQPIVLMYEVHPVFGPLFNSAAIGSADFQTQDIQLGAYPYFFSANSKKEVEYEWAINGEKLNLPKNQDFVVLQKLKPDSGQSTIKVSASNGDWVLQQGGAALNLSY